MKTAQAEQTFKEVQIVKEGVRGYNADSSTKLAEFSSEPEKNPTPPQTSDGVQTAPRRAT